MTTESTATKRLQSQKRKAGEGTVMYSVEVVDKKDGHGKSMPGETEQVVVKHHFPWDRGNEYSAGKFQKLLERGYTFERPVLKEAPLYVSDKDKGK